MSTDNKSENVNTTSTATTQPTFESELSALIRKYMPQVEKTIDAQKADFTQRSTPSSPSSERGGAQSAPPEASTSPQADKQETDSNDSVYPPDPLEKQLEALRSAIVESVKEAITYQPAPPEQDPVEAWITRDGGALSRYASKYKEMDMTGEDEKNARS